MSNIDLRYTCVALAGVNNTADLEKDEWGYRKVLLGALNVYNSEGTFYLHEDSKHCFETSNAFMRRVAAGNLHGEEDHPAWEPGMTEADFIARNEWIETKNVACHIRDVWTIITDEVCNGLPVVEIWGWVKPDRDRGPLLEAAFANPHQNVCFSLRALVREKRLPNGETIRKIDEMFTFDWVIEDGLRICNKYSSMVRGSKVAQESSKTLSDIPLTRKTLAALAEPTGTVRVGQESHRANLQVKAKRMLSVINQRPTLKRTGLSIGGW